MTLATSVFEALDQAIMGQMTGSADLTSLLAVDTTPADGPGPAIYYGEHDLQEAPFYPCALFYSETDRLDGRYIEADQEFRDHYYCMMGYTRSLRAADSAAILARFVWLFNHKLFLLPDSLGPGGVTQKNELIFCEQVGAGIKGAWDNKLRGYFSSGRFHFKTATR